VRLGVVTMLFVIVWVPTLFILKDDDLSIMLKKLTQRYKKKKAAFPSERRF
jgi:hypothetical protein